MPSCLTVALASDSLRGLSLGWGMGQLWDCVFSQGCEGAGQCDLGQDLTSDTLAWAVQIKRSLSAQCGFQMTSCQWPPAP